VILLDPLIEQILSFKKKDIPKYEKNLMVAGSTPGINLLKGKGIYAWDIEGNKYIDCTSQAYTLSLGYSHPEIVEIAREQLKYSYHMHAGFFTIPRYMLATKIAEIFPKKFNRVLFTHGGSASNEVALKIALMNKPKTHNFISLYGAYHGLSFLISGAGHMATFAYDKWMGAADFARHSYNFIKVPPPYYYRPYFKVDNQDNKDEIDERALEALEMAIRYGSTGPVCAMLMEPLQGSGGQLIFSKKYLHGVREICNKFDIMLIWDCIQTAFGRMGAWTAAQYYGVNPDIIVLGKGIAAGFPINAIVISDDIKGVKQNWFDSHTFCNNQLSQVVGLKHIEIIERDNILDNVTKVGNHLREELTRIQKEYPVIGDIRAIGFHIGIELVKDPETREPDFDGVTRMMTAGYNNGIIFGKCGVNKGLNILLIKPPLITTMEESDIILERFYSSLQEAYGKK
jgi:4-aminobutyrate aminotransferase-like enzyme